jgi:hypothetical protein
MKIIIVVGGGGDGFERDAQAFHVRVVAHLSRADLEARGVEPVAYRAREVVLGARQLARESAGGGGGGEGEWRGGVERRQLELKGVEGGD